MQMQLVGSVFIVVATAAKEVVAEGVVVIVQSIGISKVTAIARVIATAVVELMKSEPD